MKGWCHSLKRKRLFNEVEELLNDYCNGCFLYKHHKTRDYYEAMLNEEFARFLAVHLEQADEYYNGLLTVLSDEFPIDQLKAMEKEISSIG